MDRLINSGLKDKGRILLVEPPFYRFFNYQRWHYPVTLTIVGTYLKSLGFGINIYDGDRPSRECESLERNAVRKQYHLYREALKNPQHPIWREVLDIIADYKPAAVGFTAVSPKIESADILARLIKKRFGESMCTFIGGPHVEGMRRHFPDYNFGVQYDFVIDNSERMTKTIFNRNPDKELILGYDNYPPINFASVLTSVGCPNRCSFCMHSYNTLCAYRDAGNLSEEIEKIGKTLSSSQQIYLMDDCLFSDDDHFEKCAQIFSATGLKYSVGARMMALTPKKIESFIKSGGQRIFIGIESGSQKILDKVGKNIKVSEIIKRAKWLKEAGLEWTAFFMAGFPFETIDDIKATRDIISAIAPSFVSLNRFVPYPGTKMYEEYFRNSQIEFGELFQLNSRSCIKLEEDVERHIDELFDQFDEYNKKDGFYKSFRK